MIQVYGTYMVKWYKYLVNIVVKWYKYMGIKMVNTIGKDGYTCMYIYIYIYIHVWCMVILPSMGIQNTLAS